MSKSSIKNILVPTDFSKNGKLALEHASEMTKLSKGSLYLLHAIELSEPALGIYSPLFTKAQYAKAKEIAENLLDDLAVTIRKKHGIKVSTVCTSGKLYSAVVQTVKSKKIDIVIMGTHGASGFDEYFIGSNAQKVVAVSPCPVITIQAKAKKPGFSNIVLPISDNFPSRQKVNAAITIAKMYDARIHVLGLLDREGEVDPLTFKVKLDSVEKVIRKAEVKLVTKLVRTNNLPAAAINYSKKAKADLIVVMTDEESHESGLLFGVFKKQIVNHSKIPVMSIRPVKVGVYQFNALPGFH